jgi:hypothetical protein
MCQTSILPETSITKGNKNTDARIHCEKIIIHFRLHLSINGPLINCSMSDGMKYNNHILLKAISDPVNSYTRIELHNVPKAPPNSEIALPIHIKKNERFFNIFFNFTHQLFFYIPPFMYILVVNYLFKNISNSFAKDCTAFFLNTYFPSCISTNFAARNNFK